MTRRTLTIGIVTLLAAAAMAVVFVTSAVGASQVQPAPAVETTKSAADYELGAECPLGGHGDAL